MNPEEQDVCPLSSFNFVRAEPESHLAEYYAIAICTREKYHVVLLNCSDDLTPTYYSVLAMMEYVCRIVNHGPSINLVLLLTHPRALGPRMAAVP
jgi:hypothetical protein